MMRVIAVAISLLSAGAGAGAGAVQARDLHWVASSKEDADPPLDYARLVQIIGSAQGNTREIERKVLGRRILLKLKAPGPQSLVVNVKDGVFFVCQKRDPAFKSGNVQTRVLGYENTPDGDVSITLESCKLLLKAF